MKIPANGRHREGLEQPNPDTEPKDARGRRGIEHKRVINLNATHGEDRLEAAYERVNRRRGVQ